MHDLRDPTHGASPQLRTPLRHPTLAAVAAATATLGPGSPMEVDDQQDETISNTAGTSTTTAAAAAPNPVRKQKPKQQNKLPFRLPSTRLAAKEGLLKTRRAETKQTVKKISAPVFEEEETDTQANIEPISVVSETSTAPGCLPNPVDFVLEDLDLRTLYSKWGDSSSQ